MMLLHGEQYLEIRKWPIPTETTLVSYPTLVDVVDKGKAGVIYTANVMKEKSTGDDVFYTESTAFVRGAGGFNGPRQPGDRGKATRSYSPPKRSPDEVVEEKTTEEQAALYRLSGDYSKFSTPDFSTLRSRLTHTLFPRSPTYRPRICSRGRFRCSHLARAGLLRYRV